MQVTFYYAPPRLFHICHCSVTFRAIFYFLATFKEVKYLAFSIWLLLFAIRALDLCCHWLHKPLVNGSLYARDCFLCSQQITVSLHLHMSMCYMFPGPLEAITVLHPAFGILPSSLHAGCTTGLQFSCMHLRTFPFLSQENNLLITPGRFLGLHMLSMFTGCVTFLHSSSTIWYWAWGNSDYQQFLIAIPIMELYLLCTYAEFIYHCNLLPVTFITILTAMFTNCLYFAVLCSVHLL